MLIPIVVALVLFGLVLGSFVNALIWRFHAQDAIRDKLAGEDEEGNPVKKPSVKEAKKLKAELHDLSMLHGRSMCSKCHHPLGAWDLVPFFSWAFLRGKCRYCKKPIEDPPIIELVTPLLFIVSYFSWPLDMSGYGLLAFVVWLVLLVGFVALAAYDIRWFLLPDRIVWPLAGLVAVQVLLHAIVFHGGAHVLVSAIMGIVIDSGIFYVLYQVSKGEWIGGGDVKLGVILGMLAGGILPALLIIFIASLLGTLASIPMLIHKKLHRKMVIPFGPFLILAGIIIVLYGHQITSWLNNLMLA